jgi:hypothetical protein
MSDIEPVPEIIDVSTAVLSGAREKILEHRLVSDLAELMMRRGVELDVMRGEFDAHGHDVVFEAAGVLRHVQLKAMVAGGKRRDVNVNVRLRSRSSGCIAWMVYDPATLRVIEYRWFGGEPGEPLPDIGSTVARHTKGNASGEKAYRTGHRLLGKTKFETLADLGELADRLFGPTRHAATSLVLAQLRQRFGFEWRQRVRANVENPEWDCSVELAHMVDGYRVLEQLGELDVERWLTTRAADPSYLAQCVDLGDLWTTLFLEHRRWRFASPFEPSGEELRRLDALARALHVAVEAESAHAARS